MHIFNSVDFTEHKHNVDIKICFEDVEQERDRQDRKCFNNWNRFCKSDRLEATSSS